MVFFFMPTPPKHWSLVTCPAYVASKKDRNVYYCPNDNCYFYRGNAIRHDNNTWSTTICMIYTERASLQTICNKIDRELSRGAVYV